MARAYLAGLVGRRPAREGAVPDGRGGFMILPMQAALRGLVATA